jgi:phage terminase large subunit-like protein
MEQSEEYYRKLEKARTLQAKVQLQRELPHLYGWKWYPWARKFFESTNKDNFLVAANQISKSSTQIRKCIHWATAKALWPTLWKQDPLQFWYLYPSKEVATIEFFKKWVPQFLPKGEMKAHPLYGWKEEKKDKWISAVHFNSGVSVYFKTYGQDVQDLQTGTVDAIFFDEELPEELYSELNMRRTAVDGYLCGVFTATLGQEFWREAMEEIGTPNERFKDAFKLQVSMYDCLQYEDGSPSHWTLERIHRVENSCKDDAEVQRRVHGKFVVVGGRKYSAFNRRQHVTAQLPGPPPKDWHIYVGVDIGGGGEGHPGAITFIAVRPDYKRARVFKGWRGDGQITTAGDIYQKYLELKGELLPMAKFYDWQAKDFYTITSRVGDAFQPADKGHEIGEQILNVLFKNGMLTIDDGDPELKKLAVELANLKKDTPKQKAKDDFSDSLRYGVTKIPWDWSAISGEKRIVQAQDPMSEEEKARRGILEGDDDVDEMMSAMGIETELDSIQELYEV